MGSRVIVGLLLSKNADAQARDVAGYTPLHWAARNGFEDVAELLVKARNANINDSTNGGWTPLFLAAQNGHTQVVELLLKQRGANPNLADNKGLTPLHAASEKGYLEIVKLLVEAGADVNQVDKKSLRAHDYARLNDQNAVYLFLKKEERKNQKSTTGWSKK